MMRAHKFLERKAASRSLATGQAMQGALNEAWNVIAYRFGGDPTAIEATRLKLAECIDIVTPDGTTDVEQIRLMALNMLRIIDETL